LAAFVAGVLPAGGSRLEEVAAVVDPAHFCSSPTMASSAGMMRSKARLDLSKVVNEPELAVGLGSGDQFPVGLGLLTVDV
jgi:hypothetical protein